ncbi:MAG: transcription-repair coupling factor, partial [Proteobacteria bacterium]|nr:transcription-repair coupling factor [Pseudomonadota bacterium]
MNWSNQIGSSDAFNISDTLSENRLIFVITKNASEAYRVVNEIRLFSDNKEIRLLPDWETLPYDKFSPHFDLISERLETLYQITNGICKCVVSPITTLLYRLAPPSHLAKYSFILNTGATIKLDQLKNQMNNAGYQNVNQVISPGEFCIRGGVIDLFPMGSVLPYRIDLFDTEIEKIRTFDPDSQRGIYSVANIRLLPAREFPTDKKGVQTFRANFRREISIDPTRSKIYKDISVGAFPPGIEYYLPLFFSDSSVIADYLPSNTRVFILGDISSSINQFWEDTNSRYKLLRGDVDFPLLPPNSLFMTEDEFFKSIKKFDRIQISDKKSSASAKLQALPDIKVEKKFKDPLKKLRSFVETNKFKTLIFSDSLGRRQTLHAFFSSNNLNFYTAKTWKEGLSIPEKLILIEGPLTTGFIENEKQLNVITEGELYPFHARKNKKLEKSSSAEHMLKDLSEIRVGDPVVHIQHGIGTYQGLKTMNIGDGLNEYLELHYDDSDKLFLPVSQLEVISRYSGSALDSVSLDKLGSKKWDKAKKKAAKQIRDTAAELLHLYAERSSRVGYSFPMNDLEYKTFCEEFEYDETTDQLAAIEA